MGFGKLSMPTFLTCLVLKVPEIQLSQGLMVNVVSQDLLGCSDLMHRCGHYPLIHSDKRHTQNLVHMVEELGNFFYKNIYMLLHTHMHVYTLRSIHSRKTCAHTYSHT